MITFNGRGWKLNIDNSSKVIFYNDEKNRVVEMMREGITFCYVTVDENEKNIELINEICQDDRINSLVGIDNMYTNSGLYYKYVNYFGKEKLTFLNLFDELCFLDSIRIEKNDDIPYKIEKNKIYLIDAGENTVKIIRDLVKKENESTYIDIRRRLKYSSKKEWWIFNPYKVNFEISVVLTLYKKPETLQKQLEAVKEQTITANGVYLLQDGIDDGYSIIIGDLLSRKFDRIKRCKSNKGVWERFEFASKAIKTKYVCLFDDDAIPGNRWLENCHVHSQFVDGIYGTNGVLLEREFKNYPDGGFVNVGWHMPNLKCMRVDFAGHSWFLKTEYLNYIFEAENIRKKYKYVGEDLSLSVNALNHGVQTFVPPHPIEYGELWGANPTEGILFGHASVAVSLNRKRLDEMKKVVNILHAQGWDPIVVNSPEVVECVKSELYNNDEKSQIMNVMRNMFFDENVYIFGAGKFAGIISNLADYNGWKYKGFVVTKKSNEVLFHKHNIYDVDEIKDKNSFRIVFGLSEKYHREVYELLKKINCSKMFPPAKAPFSYNNFVEGLIVNE